MIRIAAVGDVHLGAEAQGCYRPHLAHVAEQADVLLLAGDLTRIGELAEAQVVAAEFADVGVPVVAVLGNHDFECGQQEKLTKCLQDAGVRVLDGESVTLPTPAGALGIAGIKGFGGGFAGACGSEFGEPEMKHFAAYARTSAQQLQDALSDLSDVAVKVALTHYAPVPDTLQGERCEIFPFLGSYLLAEAAETGGAHLVVHGHAHGGTEKGATARGVPVRNVARPVIGTAYRVYQVGDGVN